MNISVMVTGAPYSCQASQSAYHFCRSAHDEGHRVSQVFFYQDGVHNGSRLSVPPQDEASIVDDWVGLASETGVSLVVCIAAAQRRGILDAGEASREELDADNLHPAFTLAGLGLLTESVIESDRFVSFG
jgi:tRNA 2-thiouridine synthesizing protein D